MKNMICALALLMAPLSAFADSSLKDELTSTLMFMKGVYRSEYAPAGWKKTYTNWDLDREIDQALSRVQGTQDLTLAQGRQALRSFIYSMRDYHVSISFLATESASLPFTVQGVGNRYFLAYINRAKLTETAFPFQVGDELVSFGGKATADAVAELQAVMSPVENVAETDHERAILNLTLRQASRGLIVPQGAIDLGIKRQGSSQVSQFQLVWDYTPEQISDGPWSNGRSTLAAARRASENGTLSASRLLHPQMVADVNVKSAASPFDLGARKAFTPALGVKIWESEESDPFHAYIYKAADRKLMGYVRIPSYVPEDSVKALESFAKIIAMFETATDGMVIDQVNNPGGSVFYLYGLASMLSDQALHTPQHRMAITQADVLDALTQLKQLEAIKNDEDARKAMPGGLDGYPASYEISQFLVSYLRFIVSEWNAGRTLSRPYWIAGVDKINPAPVHYTKPILLVTNHLDFSGGDFFPAILQDNRRVTVFGARTAGAGGYVNDVQFPNNLGVAAFRVTESIASRIDSNPIENLGVKPDVEYTMTEADVTGGYAGYAKAIGDALLNLVK